ncbi:hypothetical protein [Streptomyces sp. NPDC021224]|uniref:hypothetical protein n=1 Tax=unclassified Streptomyces TaxID=2593676 RepID=UPI0037AD0D1F
MTAARGNGLDPAVRAALAEELLAALPAACPGSTAELRGSLAAGTADAYSDIDIAWRTPAADFARSVEGARRTLGRVGPLLSLRCDPDSAAEPGQRLLFAAFRGLPLFWRLDLVVSADVPEAATVPQGEVADPWSPAASALANAVGAIKALRRDRPDDARGLIDRGLRRVGVRIALTGVWRTDVARLVAASVAADPAQQRLASAVEALASELLPR